MDGDGRADLVVGACMWPGAGTNAGSAYLLLGPVTGTRSLADSTGIVLGEAEGDYVGRFVAGAGDTNGDGYSDVLASNRNLTSDGTDAPVMHLGGS